MDLLVYGTDSYQREADKGKLTAVASFEKLMFRACAVRWSKVEDYGLCVFIYWGMELCYWWNHSKEGCMKKLEEC